VIKKKNTILITGATGLLGAEFVKNFGAQGHSIIFTSRNQKKINILSKKLNNLGANKIVGINIDLEEDGAVDKIILELIKKKVYPNILINNARNLKFSNTDNKGNISKTNWLGENFMSMALPHELSMKLTYMKNTKLKKIINISSIYGVSVPNLSIYKNPNKESPVNYGTSKAGMIHLTKELAIRLVNKNITVNAISYGGVKGRASKEFVKKYSSISPQNKMLRLNEIFGPLDFLISDNSKNINGHNLIVDGGWTL